MGAGGCGAIVLCLCVCVWGDHAKVYRQAGAWRGLDDDETILLVPGRYPMTKGDSGSSDDVLGSSERVSSVDRIFRHGSGHLREILSTSKPYTTAKVE